METIERKTHKIDATDKAPGRLASEIAQLLLGKHKPGFVQHVDMGDSVVVENVEKMKFTGKKLDQKVYYKHTNHPGGLKEIPVKKVMEETPAKVLEHAVRGMLPDNKLRKDRLKRLIIK